MRGVNPKLQIHEELAELVNLSPRLTVFNNWVINSEYSFCITVITVPMFIDSFIVI